MRDAKHDYTYDGEGNLTSKKVRASGATTRFVWDSEHRLVELVKPSGATVRYRYDAAGMRVQATRSSDGRVTTWGYNGSSVAAVWRQTAGEPRVLVSTFVTAPSGDPLQSTSDGETVYSMLDGLGSVTGTLDASGAVASSSAYSVFGQPAGTGAVGLGDAVGYTGHAWDGDAGMHFARARWYDAGVGRFASEDPVDAMNLYSYVGNQPLDYHDPTGEFAVEVAATSQFGADFAKATQYVAVPAFGALTLLPQLIGMGKHGVNRACLWDTTVTASFWAITFESLRAGGSCNAGGGA
ncbi:RHS repeat-associated core domain-containing protein [Nocardioides jishulii]|uniref:RHS repeat-associated core domain-containing protein n=1 Tax=Nocardioides jishulii TaxID=2575440 RepID=UPI001485A7A6|nr:RHS repeat-associated core domain-containing protein [Nocardioides jishulii]